MAAGCDWLAVGWKYRSGPSHHAASYLVSYSEADNTAWQSSTIASHDSIAVTAQQARISGLRAGVAYVVRVTALVHGHQSEWATSPLFRTAVATQTPEPPLAPQVLGDGDCHRIVRLRLPAPQTGCRSATEASLQYSSPELITDQGSSTWRDYDTAITTSDVDLYDLKPNASYRFRLVAHNAAGRSHSGTPSDLIGVCNEVSTGAAASNLGIMERAAQLWEKLEEALGLSPPVDVLVVIACIAIGFLCRVRCTRTRRLGHGARYERASTKPSADDEFGGADSATGSGHFEGAYDEFAQTLCVHVFVPASSKPVQIEMSTDGLTSSSLLLKQLQTVVSEVAGRQPPLESEELSVVFEDGNTGVQERMHAGIELDEVFGASRVIASIAQLPRSTRVKPSVSTSQATRL